MTDQTANEMEMNKETIDYAELFKRAGAIVAGTAVSAVIITILFVYLMEDIVGSIGLDTMIISGTENAIESFVTVFATMWQMPFKHADYDATTVSRSFMLVVFLFLGFKMAKAFNESISKSTLKEFVIIALMTSGLMVVVLNVLFSFVEAFDGISVDLVSGFAYGAFLSLLLLIVSNLEEYNWGKGLPHSIGAAIYESIKTIFAAAKGFLVLYASFVIFMLIILQKNGISLFSDGAMDFLKYIVLGLLLVIPDIVGTFIIFFFGASYTIGDSLNMMGDLGINSGIGDEGISVYTNLGAIYDMSPMILFGVLMLTAFVIVNILKKVFQLAKYGSNTVMAYGVSLVVVFGIISQMNKVAYDSGADNIEQGVALSGLLVPTVVIGILCFVGFNMSQENKDKLLNNVIFTKELLLPMIVGGMIILKGLTM